MRANDDSSDVDQKILQIHQAMVNLNCVTHLAKGVNGSSGMQLPKLQLHRDNERIERTADHLALASEPYLLRRHRSMALLVGVAGIERQMG